MQPVLDLSQCDREPVAFVGKIQNFGGMLIVDPPSGSIVGASENIKDLLHLDPMQIFGKKLITYLPEFEEHLEESSDTSFLYKDLHVSRFKSGPYDLYEIEKAPAPHEHNLIAQLSELQSSKNLNQLLSKAAEVIFQEVNFARVMIYRFHEDMHGEVVAEKVKKGTDSFLGLHYPASDIPAPARALFLEKYVRVIPDVSATPIALLPANVNFDLTTSTLRAASPIHIQYLRNMGVGASLTISLIVEGKLWGLIACHHDRPKLVTPAQRENCEIIGRMISTHINEALRTEEIHHKDKIRAVHKKLIQKISNAQDMSEQLTQNKPTLLDLIDSGGVSAALYIEGHWVSTGNVPSDKELDEIVSFLHKNHADQPVFHTHALSSLLPSAKAYAPIASGLMAAAIPKGVKNYVLWFRPEVIQTVSWAGNPHEKVIEANGRLSPRGSFEEWKESVRETSYKWKSWELDAALELRNGIISVDLRRQYEKEQRARAEAERAVKSREELVEVVSHDLRNPLTSMQMNLRLIDRLLASEDGKVRAMLERVIRSTKVMKDLIEDILSVTKMESGNLHLDIESGSVVEVLKSSIELLSPIAIEKGISLSMKENPFDCHANFDEGRLLQVLSNLIGNAIKFTPEQGHITIGLEKCGPEFVKILVQDSGSGMPKEDLPFVFDRFWQANQAKKMGTGLGLAIVKGIIVAHGGEIWVESDIGKGTTFHFTLPLS